MALPCNSIFEVQLPAPDGSEELSTIAVNAGLTATTQYFYIISDKFGNEYVKQVETDGTGSLVMQVSDFPLGLFNPYAGSFLLQIKKTLQDELPQSLTFCAKSYDTVNITFKKIAGASSYIIDCK